MDGWKTDKEAARKDLASRLKQIDRRELAENAAIPPKCEVRTCGNGPSLCTHGAHKGISSLKTLNCQTEIKTVTETKKVAVTLDKRYQNKVAELTLSEKDKDLKFNYEGTTKCD